VDAYPTHRQSLPSVGLSDAALRSAGDAIMVLDLDGVVVLWNDGCEVLFGWTAAEMIGRTPEVLMPEDRRQEFLRLLRALSGTPESAALETWRVHKSGELRPVSCRVSAVLAEDGSVLGASAVVRDNSREMELREQLEQARHLAEARFTQSVVAQATLAPDTTIVDVNPALCSLSGYDAKQLLGRSVLEFMRDDELQVAGDRLDLLASGQISDSQHPRLLRHADGHFVETRVSIFAVRDDAGQVLRLEAVVEDVSAAAAAQRELQLREARWTSLELHSADVALFCDRDAKLLFASSSALLRFGYDPDMLVGADGFAFIHPDDEPGVRAIWGAVAAAPSGTTQVFRARLRHADGTWRWVEDSVTNALDDPAVGAMIVNITDITDITELKSAEAVLEELVGSDTLTGLATRAPLMAALDAAFASDAAPTTALAVVDITRLKLVNDTYGHRAGDSVLTQVAGRLVDAVGPRAIVARIGGDRFAVMLSGIEEIGDLFEAVAALLPIIGRPIALGQDTVVVNATVGAALGPAVDSGALVASAESALLTAKEGLTGPLYVVRAESASAAVGRARLIEDLRRGIDADELVVHFQPVVSLSDSRVVGAEALVRWNHPEKGLLSPGAFIAAAEDSGLIIDVGHKVLLAACAAAARWAPHGDRHNPFHVAVNLSAKQLTRSGVVDVVREALRLSGAPPQCLVLEVTESAVMSDIGAAVATLQELRDLGVGIAVDDFGTGYSSLTYLKQFPVTALKIDRSFVNGLGQNSDDAAIVASVLSLARAMQLECIAEGVETEQQRLVLQALGGTHAQGFLWAPAMDAATFETWLGPARSGAAASGTPGRARKASSAQPVLPAPSTAEEDAAALRRVVELSNSGASLHTIAAALNAEQLVTAQRRRWTSRSVAVVLATSANNGTTDLPGASGVREARGSH
jgi:diguanylate cyclase (GGDEF)-like protein/PAS domain S-box-containing protein